SLLRTRMSQSNSSASSEPPADDNRRGPFAIVPKYDCPHLGENAYVLLQSTQQQDDQQ
ncbi:unnamed protein product, partial [Rotaria magnacalcarata]